MQTKLFCRLMIVGAIVITLASCSKTNTQGRLIPKEAAVVTVMDGKALSSKLPWDEIKKNPLFEEIRNDSTIPASLKGLLDNPETSGIDAQADVLFFVVKDSIGGYICVEGTVKDSAAFKTFNKQVAENGVETEVEGTQFISKSPVCVGWTKDKFVYIINAPQMAQMDDLSRRMRNDSITPGPASARDIGATCKAIFALPESNSLAKNEKFTALMKKSGDVRFWVNSEEFIKSSPSASAMAMVNLDRFYKGAITTAVMNFENGKMVFSATSYASGELMDLFKKYGGGKISEDMIKRIPGKDAVAVMALNFKPEALDALLKMTGLDGLVNAPLKNFGFTWQDFIKANKGDILFGVTDLALKADTSRFKFEDQDEHVSITQKPSFNFVFSASIGDKDAFNKLVAAAKKFGGQMMGDNGKAPVAYNSNGNLFVLSNTQATADQYLAASNNNFDFISKISGEPFGGYLNIQSLMKAFGSEASKDSSAKIVYDASLKMWDNISWKGGNYGDGGLEQTAEVNLVDKSTNSLKQLNQYAATLSQVYKEQKKKQKEMMADMVMTVDTVAVAMPPTAKLPPPAKKIK